MPQQYVILGDVVDSRDIDDREGFTERLEAACTALSRQYSEAFVAPLTSVKGIDEIAGVVSTPAPVYDIADELQRRLAPEEIRLAVAAGEIDVGLSTGEVAAMDGPAFHCADDKLEEIRGTEYRFTMALGDERLDPVVADEVNLLLWRKWEWTERQQEVVARYRELGSQSAVAEELGVSQPAVSRALERAGWGVIQEIEGRLRRTLRQYE